MMLVFAVTAGLAFSNGANDVSKGVATLVGSGITGYRRALSWGTAWTIVGALLGGVLGGAMLTTFGGGLLTSGEFSSPTSAPAMLTGATAWVLIATRLGFPVSTTHALVGALTGVAVAETGIDAVHWSALGGKVVLPLLASPLLALGLTLIALRVFPARRGALMATDCLCAEWEPVLTVVAGSEVAAGAAAVAGSEVAGAFSRLVVTTGTTGTCARTRPWALRLTIDRVHWLSSGATSLARGLNDAPKIVGLGLAASIFAPGLDESGVLLFITVALGMAAGGLWSGRRVTRVLATRVTPMDHREGLVANLVTASLVATGAHLGLPMSTTHVSAGGIAGVGIRRRALQRGVARNIAWAWVVTVPAAAALSLLAFTVMTRML